MTLKAEYITAIERRLAWLKWAKTGKGMAEWERLGFGPAIPSFLSVLESSPTFYMTPHFSQLVDHARRQIPDGLKFDASWMNSERGWLWLDEPFAVPELDPKEWENVARERQPGLHGTKQIPIHVRAVGWQKIPVGSPVFTWHNGQMSKEPTPAPAGAYHFCCFQDLSLYFPGKPGFGCWSYFLLRDGAVLFERVVDFEERQATGQYKTVSPDRRHEPLHEIRWIYTAMHLMAQRLAITVKHDTDRSTRRRAEREGQKAPPFINVVTLRRMEAARQKDPKGNNVDWQWQWQVAGHWRDQWYPSEGVHKPKFIESYIKGPADKPLKPDSIKLYVAER